MTAIVNESLKKGVIEIFRREKPVERLFAFDLIPANKLKNAKDSYASSLGDDEALVFMYDDTLRESAKDGFILTTKRLYTKNFTESGCYTNIENIRDMAYKPSKLSPSIAVRTDFASFEIQITCANDKTALFNVLDSTVRLLKVQISEGKTYSRIVCKSCGAYNAGAAAVCEYCESPLK